MVGCGYLGKIGRLPISKAMVSVTVVKGLTLKACNYVNTDLPI